MTTKLHRVVIADFIDDSLDVESEVLQGVATVEALRMQREADLVGRIEDADAVMLYHCLAFGPETIARLERCKVIARCGVGFDNVDYRFARERGIPVVNVPDYGTEEVADTAIGLTLALTRGFSLLNSRLRGGDGDWSYGHAAPVHRLRGRSFAMVGLGRIGTATALRAKALGMNVRFYDPYKPDGYDKALGVRRVETLDELLESAWVLSLHCPLSGETHHLIDADAIAQLPRGAFLVNTARGGVVDVAAVPAAIESGHLAGAGIDVLEDEPPAAGHPLIAAWRDPQHPAHHRVIVNPHAAFYSEEGLRDMRIKGAEACRRALLGMPLRNVVNQ